MQIRNTSCLTELEKASLSERIQLLEKENISLKETLTLEKTHIEELDEQFKTFLQERDGLKKKNKDFEKKIKLFKKEKEALHCECETLKSKIKNFEKENKILEDKMKSNQQKNEILKSELELYQKKNKDISEESKTIVEQLLSLNEENRNLSRNIDVLRESSEYTTSLNQDVSKLNMTIEELNKALESITKAQNEEEMIHQKNVSQLNDTIQRLEEELKHLQKKYQNDVKTCKICRGKSKVGFLETTEVQTTFESEELNIIKDLDESNVRMRKELEKKSEEINVLSNRVNELQTALNSCEEKVANFQEAVSLYSNSIFLLETQKQKLEDQIQQQNITIANLQQALVESKQELDEMKESSQENDYREKGIIRKLQNILQETESKNYLISRQTEIVNKEYENLQDINFTLEVEHCNTLQDIDVLEKRLNKYKSFCYNLEAQMKKLSKQKKYYEEIIAYFKQEMGVMADQLNNLQELLVLSNETAQQESSKIMKAFMDVHSLNERLSSQLCACEQKVLLENQMNQLNEAKICELQKLINEKEMDLSKHDQVILNIQKNLNESLSQNEELQKTIVELNRTIKDLQCAVDQYELDNCASKRNCLEFQQEIGGYSNKLEELKKRLDEKTTEAMKLEMAYNSEKRALNSAQRQLQATEILQQESCKELINQLEDLRNKLKISNENNNKLCKEYESLQNQMVNLSRKEAVKDLEIKRYRKIVGDLKSTMMDLNSELNKNLVQKECEGFCKNNNCRQNAEKEEISSQDLCLSCPCEIEFYQNMVDILKKSVSDLKQKLEEIQLQKKKLENEVKLKDTKMFEIEKENEKLNQEILRLKSNDSKISQLEEEIHKLRQQLQKKNDKLKEITKNAEEINESKCNQLAYAQEELANLKVEMSTILDREYNIKRENEELRNQTAQLQCHINCLNEKTRIYKNQIEQNLMRMRNLNSEKQSLVKKNKELFSELKPLQSKSCNEDKINREKTCNSQIKDQTPTNICKLNRTFKYPSPCSLESQDTASFYGESSPTTPDYDVNEWYSNTFRNESENDSEEEYCVTALENLTLQMKKSNKLWSEENRAYSRNCKGVQDRKNLK